MSTETLHIEYNRAPLVPLAFAKAALPKAGGLKGGTIPRIEADLRNVRIPTGKLDKYRRICGFEQSEYLPITYPHILASSLHLGVMTQKQFPLRLLGLVHVRNEITQHRPIRQDEAVSVHVYVDGHRDVHNGIEFDLMTSITDAKGEVAWEEVSTILSRGKGGKGSKGSGGKRKKSAEAATLQYTQTRSWDAPADIGRKYGLNAGDINPIHMSAVSAKLFGFPRAIAHGMWSLARCAAEIEADMPRENVTFAIAFKQPVFLPGSVTLKYGIKDNGVDYALQNPDGSKLHLSGHISFQDKM